MTQNNLLEERLLFLAKVIKREIKHLKTTDHYSILNGDGLDSATKEEFAWVNTRSAT